MTNLTRVSLTVLIFCSGCSLQDPPSILKESISEETIHTNSVKITAIKNYLGNKELTETRSGNYRLLPIISQEDTLMYLAQYDSGWELFSNSLSAPMSLMKCNHGEFHNEIKENSDFLDFYLDLQYLLVSDIRSKGNTFEKDYSDWILYNNDLRISTHVNDNEEEGVYTLVGAKEYISDQKKIAHLINTTWHQNDPCNKFMPFQKYSPSSHIFVGCGPVATGHFLYYSHNKWGVPTTFPSSATYDPISNQYVFSNPTSSEWNKIPLVPLSNDNQLPIFLGWIAKELNVTPLYSDEKHTGTSTYLEDINKFIRKETSFQSNIISYSLNTVSDFIHEEKPVILHLSSKNGHFVVIDALDYTETTIDYYYAYIKDSSGNTDPTKPIGPDTGTTDDYDYLANKYGMIYTESYLSRKSYLQFRWGWKYGYCDDVLINGEIMNLKSDNPDVNGYIINKIINYIN